MFDIGWPELVVILIVAIIVIGPRDLPKAFHTVGKWVRAARRVTADFQRHVDDMVRETELEDLKKVATEARSFNVKNQIEKAVDPTGDLKSSLELDPAAADKPKTPTPNMPASRGPSVPLEAKAEPKVSDEAAPAVAEAKPTAKPASSKAAPAKTAAKTSPRVPSRVPKKKAAAKSTASKTPTSEQAS